jgi:hypothetical protein
MKELKKETGLSTLTASDWLKSDRKNNTQVWQNANMFNLTKQLPSEYETIIQKRDFYEWLYKNIENKGHEVIWPKMAHYISKKLRLTKVFPFNVFTRKEVKDYAYIGSETVFNSAFIILGELYNSDEVLKNDNAKEWDASILYKEQYLWLEEIYSDVDSKTLKIINKMAQGKGFYKLLVPKAIRFNGDITKADTRYNYALETLRPYCKKHYQ